MRLKNSFHKLIVFFAIIQLNSFALAEDGGDPPSSEACGTALRNAKTDLENMVYGRNPSSQTQTSSTSTSTDGQQQQNPMTEIMNQITQTQQKQAEITQQAMEQARQLDSERYKQLNDINDKIHEFERGDFKRRMAITDAATALKKQQAEVRIACQAKAEEDYNKEFERLNLLSANSTYQVSDMSRMSGTNSRMRASLAVYRRRCDSDPKTREKLQLAQDEYDAKMHNFQIASEEIASDVSYTQSKIGLLEAHMVDQKNQLAESVQMQQAALQQQMQMQMMNMAFGMMTSSTGQQQQNQTAQQFRSADETLTKWDEIYKKCRNATTDSIAVPSDVMNAFSEVNYSCRGKDSGIQCVKDSGQQSIRTPTNTTSF